jgi:hypothetical protein
MLTGCRARFLTLALVFAVAACAAEAPPGPEAPPAPDATSPEGATGADAGAESAALSAEQCRSQSGEVLTDPGDGSLHTRGCPDGRTRLGSVRVGIEGGLCCALASPVPPAAGKRRPCTLGADQECNDDPAISALWGRCTELGVCECKTGFELSLESGRCKPAH